MTMKRTLIVLLISGLAFAAATIQNEYSKMHALKKTPNIPPFHDRQPLTVKLGLDLIGIRDVDEERGEVELVAYMRYGWEDPSLAWSRSSSAQNFAIDVDKIWTPDITPYNQVETPEVLTPKLAILSPRGKVTYVPSVRMRFNCDLANLDSGKGTNCTLKMGSWTQNGDKIDLKTMPNDMLSNFEGDPRVDVLGVVAEREVQKYSCCPESYVNVKFIFTLRRKGSGLMSWFN